MKLHKLKSETFSHHKFKGSASKVDQSGISVKHMNTTHKSELNRAESSDYTESPDINRSQMGSSLAKKKKKTKKKPDDSKSIGKKSTISKKTATKGGKKSQMGDVHNMTT
jgi:hypothetical protein